jgi:hypothetical protein
MIRSESTNALGHPSDTKLTFGATPCSIVFNLLGVRRSYP